MRFSILSLLALAATSTAQNTKPKISADELVKSMVVLTDALHRAVEKTEDISSETDAVKMLSKDMVDIGRASSVAVQALPRPDKENTFQYPDEKQGPVCDGVKKLVKAGFSLVDGLDSATDTLLQAPELQKPIKVSATLMGKALGGLVGRTVAVTDCAGVEDGEGRKLREGFEGVVARL